MKSLVILFTGIALFVNAQNYYITFSAGGEASSIDSIRVENITRCYSITIQGTDVLNLTSATGINDLTVGKEDLVEIYPVPARDYFYMHVNNDESCMVCVEIYDIAGRKISGIEQYLERGDHQFKVSLLSSGMYVLLVKNKSKVQTLLITYEGFTGLSQIEYIGKTDYEVKRQEGNGKNVVQMLYQPGEVIKFTGYSGIYKTVVVRKPEGNENVIFTFVRCVDNQGYSYAVIKIGNQWWMAENLNAGIYSPITSPQQSGTKFCMNINGVADPSCPMGGLYEWYNLMQGASGCNGSGAPPNDRCPTPVRGLCPEGWHIPSHFEWVTLLRSISSNPSSFPYDMSSGVIGTIEGGMLKDNCTDYWWPPNAGATNISGFSALPGGDTWQGVFEDYGQSAYFWTSTAYFNYSPWVYALNYTVPLVGRSFYVPENGFSCRCVKD